MVDIEARVHGWFLGWEIQLVKEGSLDVGHIKIQWLWIPPAGEKKTDLVDNSIVSILWILAVY
jgi:hypothetical protein